MIKVCPSTNPCPEDNLLDYAKGLYDMGVEYLHCDVMDGVFVENKCLDFETLKNVRNNCNIGLDVHLMVKNIYKNVKQFASLKPNILTIHYESTKSRRELIKCIKYIRSKDILVGLSIKPDTSIKAIQDLLKYIDLLLIMSVEPGKSGQTFIGASLTKIQEARVYKDGYPIIIEVDGGINEDNFKQIINAGADFLVMGNAFYNAKNRAKLLASVDKHYQK